MKRERTAAIVVARMSSSRLWGKVLADLGGKPLLAHLLERLEHCSVVNRYCVATSKDTTDDAIMKFCAERDELCVRGSLSDVGNRVLQAADELDAPFIFRANADSPFLPTDLYEEACDVLARTHADVVTNVLPRTSPPGAAVELIRVEALRDALSRFGSDYHREHVTSALYAHSDEYQVEALPRAYRFPPGLRLAVDSMADLQFARELLLAMVRPHWQYSTKEIIRLAEVTPHVA